MLRSLFAGISGLRVNQTMLDVTGNNIANANTIGFKSSTTVFQDTLSQMLTAASAPGSTRGGTNPIQIGLGTSVAGVHTNFTQGSNETTGGATDMMINGDGFFVVADGANQYYTRAGSFSFDASGNLVAPDGKYVQGYQASGYTGGTSAATGKSATSAAVSDTSLGLTNWAGATSLTVTLDGKDIPVDLTNKSGIDNVTTAISNAIGTDGWTATNDGTNITFSPVAHDATTHTLKVAGVSVNMTAGSPDVSAVSPSGTTFAPTLSKINLSNNQTAAGFPNGANLQSYEIGADGTITGTYDDGEQLAIGKIAIANCSNPEGLEKVGDTEYAQSANSGRMQIGTANQVMPGTGQNGSLTVGSLEMSNVDLAAEFTNLIIAQRGFEASSKVITTSDTVLQDLVDMKR